MEAKKKDLGGQNLQFRPYWKTRRILCFSASNGDWNVMWELKKTKSSILFLFILKNLFYMACVDLSQIKNL